MKKNYTLAIAALVVMMASVSYALAIRKGEYYIPKSEKKRLKHEMALKRLRKAEKKRKKFD